MSVEGRRHKLGIVLGSHESAKPWSAAEIAFFGTASDAKVAALLGRISPAVAGKRYQLGMAASRPRKARATTPQRARTDFCAG
jgi:hypothetical protein